MPNSLALTTSPETECSEHLTGQSGIPAAQGCEAGGGSGHSKGHPASHSAPNLQLPSAPQVGRETRGGREYTRVEAPGKASVSPLSQAAGISESSRKCGFQVSWEGPRAGPCPPGCLSPNHRLSYYPREGLQVPLRSETSSQLWAGKFTPTPTPGLCLHLPAPPFTPRDPPELVGLREPSRAPGVLKPSLLALPRPPRPPLPQPWPHRTAGNQGSSVQLCFARSPGTLRVLPSLPSRDLSTPPPPTPVPTSQTLGARDSGGAAVLRPPRRGREGGQDPPPCAPHIHPREAAVAVGLGAGTG